MSKLRIRAINGSALYIHMTPELLKSLKTKLIMLQVPYVELKLTTYRNQYKSTRSNLSVGKRMWLEGKLVYPDLYKAGGKIEAYWRFYLTRDIPF